MRVYGNVYTAFWIDHKIHQISTGAKLLAVYLLTTSHSNMLGCFRLPFGYITEDLNWDLETVSKGFQELCDINFLIHDQTNGWVLICNYLKWNPLANPNQGKSIEKLFRQIPPTLSFYQQVIDILLTRKGHLSSHFLDYLETVSKRFQNQYQEQEQITGGQEQEKIRHRRLLRHSQEEGPEKIKLLPTSTFSSLLFVIEIPLCDDHVFCIEPSMVEEWQALYPAVDVLQQLKNIRGWNLANPTKRKTNKNILPHINQWLAKENATAAKGFMSEKSEFFDLLNHNTQVAKAWLDPNNSYIEGELNNERE